MRICWSGRMLACLVRTRTPPEDSANNSATAATTISAAPITSSRCGRWNHGTASFLVGAACSMAAGIIGLLISPITKHARVMK